MYPNVALEDSELSDLGSHSSYVAGFTDAAVEARTDLYDLFVNGEQSCGLKGMLSRSLYEQVRESALL